MKMSFHSPLWNGYILEEMSILSGDKSLDNSGKKRYTPIALTLYETKEP